jgi:phage shock protein PspC (stress-responsive transcriptional regulator)
MTTDETQAPPQGTPAGPYPPISTLRRSRQDRKLFGVAGGLGRYAGVDPLIFRILFVVLTFFGGSGILLYALGWLLLPEDGENESEGQRLLRGHTTGSTVRTVVAGVVVLILGLVFMGAVLDTGPGLGGLGALIVVGLIVVLLVRNGQRPGAVQVGTTPTYGPVPPPDPGAYGQTPGTAYVASAPGQGPPPPVPPPMPTMPLPPVPPAPPRERSMLGRLTVSATLLVVGLMLLWNMASDGASDDFRAVAVFGAALAVVAIGLLVGAVAGRSRGLILLGILLSIATSVAAAVDQRVAGGIGERTWQPSTVAGAERPHRLGIGDAELYLTDLPDGSGVDVNARLGIGELRIYVPFDAAVTVDGEVGAGNAVLLDEREENGTDVHVTASAAPVASPSGTEIRIDAEVGFGQLKVVRR